MKEAERQSPNGVGTFSKQEAERLYYKKLVQLSCVHPDTGETIPFFARVSAFIPMNLPIFVGMILSPPTMKATVFWQWVNQTYNAGFNYGNRNASSVVPLSETIKSYGMACASSISAALVLRKITSVAFGGRTGLVARVANSFALYAAVAFSSSLNVYCMR